MLQDLVRTTEPKFQVAKPPCSPPPLYNKCGVEPRVKPMALCPEMWTQIRPGEVGRGAVT
jgi:hypothetical protein